MCLSLTDAKSKILQLGNCAWVSQTTPTRPASQALNATRCVACSSGLPLRLWEGAGQLAGGWWRCLAGCYGRRGGRAASQPSTWSALRAHLPASGQAVHLRALDRSGSGRRGVGGRAVRRALRGRQRSCGVSPRTSPSFLSGTLAPCHRPLLRAPLTHPPSAATSPCRHFALWFTLLLTHVGGAARGVPAEATFQTRVRAAFVLLCVCQTRAPRGG